jgi:hypothetical protein
MRTNDATYTDLMKIRDRLDRRHSELQSELADVTRKLESVSMTLALLDDGETESPASSPETEVTLRGSFSYGTATGSVDVASLRGMTQVKALEKIAEHSGGQFTTTAAKRFLIQADLIKNPKNANNIIFSVIQRSGKFERVEPGVYRLVADKPVRPIRATTDSLALE